jgi:hypothetical protein
MRYAAIVDGAGDCVRHSPTRAMKVVRRHIFWEQRKEAGSVSDGMGEERSVVERPSGDLGSTPCPIQTARFVAHDNRHPLAMPQQLAGNRRSHSARHACDHVIRHAPSCSLAG